MIITEFYKGQGLGNQLWCYVTLRVMALDRGLDFGIQSPERFKGIDFMDIDFGRQVFGGSGPEGGPPDSLPEGIRHHYAERGLYHPDGSDIRERDGELFRVSDGTKIDGCLQDERSIEHRKDEIRQWLAVSPDVDRRDFSDDGICVINFRGGTYAFDEEFFLPQSYWNNAMKSMSRIKPGIRFIVITDDVRTAKKFFPALDVFHFSIGEDYSIIKNAKYLILSNSSFAWFPAWLSTDLRFCIAPKYWARHNVSDGYWSLGYNITKGWTYQDRDGKLQSYGECLAELESYMKKNRASFSNKPPKNAKSGALARVRASLKVARIAFALEKKNSSFPKAVASFVGMYARKSVAHARKIAILTSARVRGAAIRALKRYPALRVLKSTLSAIGRLIRRVFRATGAAQIVEWMRDRKSKRGWLSPDEIRQRRKEIRVYDAFTFFNEADLLEIRLEILGDYVDKFVIAEATQTFSGHPKPLNFLANKDRYKKWEDKIIYHVIDDAPKDENDLRSKLHASPRPSVVDRKTVALTLTADHLDRSVTHWMREFYIKESLRKPLEDLEDDDFVYVSDLDEIWNPELLIDYAKDDIFKPMQLPYAYYLNNRTDEHWTGWTGTIATKWKNIRAWSINYVRTHSMMRRRYSFLKNGGWHFGFQGGLEGALKKINDSKHFWYNPKEVLPNIAKRVANNVDFRGRSIRLWVDEKGLPRRLMENREKYKKFFK